AGGLAGRGGPLAADEVLQGSDRHSHGSSFLEHRPSERVSLMARLTAAQALIRFLAAQHVERDGVERRFFEGCFGIFGHGNVAGVGQALGERPDFLRYYQARNEQAMVHAASGFARMRNRLATLACTTSVGPGATTMATGAAQA